jgi:hypothetical protein
MTSHRHTPNLAQDKTRVEWVTPTLKYLGQIGDLVRGETKSGPNADADPNDTQKIGMG